MSGKAFFFLRLNDHIQYLKKIQATLKGEGDFMGTDYHDCKLGKWLYNEGPDEASAVSEEVRLLFDTLFEPHQKFHDASHMAIKMQQSGNSKEAEAALTEMHKLSNILVTILLELDKKSN